MFTIPTNFFAGDRPFNWRQMTLTGDVPSARFILGMTYVPGKGSYVYSGTTDANTVVDANMYLITDTGVCTQLTISGMPLGRWGYGMYYNPTDSLIHILSGYNSVGLHTYFDVAPPTTQAANLTFDPATNTFSSASTIPGAPEPGTFATATYGVTHDRVAWWAGQVISSANATQMWVLQGGTWFIIDPGPPSRQRTAITFDESRNRFVLFGGEAGGTVFSDTWETEGDPFILGPWAPKQAMLAGRSGAYAAWSSLYGTMCFGGSDGTTYSNNTYLYDGTTWSLVTPLPVAPSPRGLGACTWSSGLNRYVIFGGQRSVGGLTNEMWTFGK